ncbi:MAG: patatin-like phospholipase family protein [Candidatus Neomarinimicrobiota bacterium]|jgi:NTE family protein|nr:patatin-like phospholipase family protein [Candidatus Neomarinimicrobiota bacterium]MDD3966390.1 patatin-like phospholipase family protein [Candidatus Neomarinimicrobiota bacterium]MDX9780786.1 patatin-like phospholipase family protein [bacterium]
MKWALVLSGGGGNGIAHIGVLRELERMCLRPDLIVGTSMGSVVGGIYASGKSADWICNYLKNDFNIREAVSLQTIKWGEGPVVKALVAGEALHNLRTKLGAESGEKILKLLREVSGDINIEDTVIPFACNAVNLLSGKEVVFNKGNLAEAIRCSIAIPPFFEPYEKDDILYVDGGFSDNLPIHIAHEMGFKKVLSVNVVPLRPLSKAHVKNGVDVLFRLMTITINGLHRHKDATVSLTAYKGAYNFDFDHIDELVELGELTVRNQSDLIRKKFSTWPKKKKYNLQ